MSSRSLSISVVVVALLLTACPPAVKVSVYNNTPDPITIIWLRSQKLTLASHSAATLPFPPVLKSFSVLRRGAQREYVIQYPRKEFMYPSYTYGLQIQPSGKIYAVQSMMPATAFPTQPSGYPLLPRQ
jgi:hypothetical protein